MDPAFAINAIFRFDADRLAFHQGVPGADPERVDLPEGFRNEHELIDHPERFPWCRYCTRVAVRS